MMKVFLVGRGVLEELVSKVNHFASPHSPFIMKVKGILVTLLYPQKQHLFTSGISPCAKPNVQASKRERERE